jgi:uncharacterized membrane protein YgcG
MQNTDFGRDAQEVLKGLEEALNKLHRKIDMEVTRNATLKSTRANMITAHTIRLLPDLEPATLNELHHIKGFLNSQVTSVFEKAQAIHVPLLSRMTTGTKQYRLDALSKEFILLRMQLTSFIDRDTQNARFDNVQAMSMEIQKSSKTIKELESKKVPLQTDLENARRMNRDLQGKKTVNIPPEFATSINTHANSLREIRRSQSRGSVRTQSQSSGEDASDLILWWAFGIPTSGRTFMMDMFTHDHNSQPLQPEAEFVGGGGRTGGGGAGGSWDTTAAVQSENVAVSNDPSSPDFIATDDSQGKYS